MKIKLRDTRKPLVITEDGVKIYDLNTFVYGTHNSNHNKIWKISLADGNNFDLVKMHSNDPKKIFIYFSTKEAALKFKEDENKQSNNYWG